MVKKIHVLIDTIMDVRFVNCESTPKLEVLLFSDDVCLSGFDEYVVCFNGYNPYKFSIDGFEIS